MNTFTNTAMNRNNVFATRPLSGPSCVGNLVRNGRFENNLNYWQHKNVRIVSGEETHEGQGAAGLGAYRNNRKGAWIYQCIPLPRVSYPLYFQLFFSVAGYRNAPAKLDVTLSWFDTNIELIEHGIEAAIQRKAIGDGSMGKWNAYTFVSDRVPEQADFAVLRFCKRPGVNGANFVVIDDVILVPVMPSCYNDADDPWNGMEPVVEDLLPACDFTDPTSE